MREVRKFVPVLSSILAVIRSPVPWVAERGRCRSRKCRVMLLPFKGCTLESM